MRQRMHGFHIQNRQKQTKIIQNNGELKTEVRNKKKKYGAILQFVTVQRGTTLVY